MGLDYEKLGFRCGLECHQQLEGKKLFCSCPTLNLRDTKPDIIFERKLRAVAGETGMIDAAAKHEMEKSKKIIYEADSKDVCLVEMDEEPPHSINQEAVDVAVQVSLILKAKIVDEIQVMRKTVIDGSNTSGFQRTALIAYDGILETSKGIVNIPTILLEEEAAQPLEKKEDFVKYRLDRLGIPLIEIGTDASIKDPDHAKEVAEKIGMILRSTGKVKRGIGTIRQDVNVSISGKNRVEIKGFQEIKIMPKVIEKEVQRQLALTKKEESNVRTFNQDGTTNYMRPMPGADRMYPETDVLPLKIDIKKIKQELPELIEEKAKKYEKLSLNPDLAKFFAKNQSKFFDESISQFKNLKPAFIASILLSTIKDLETKLKLDVKNITEEHLKELFKALDEGKISKSVIENVLVDFAKGTFKSFENYAGMLEEDLEKEIKLIIKEKPNLSIGGYMGLIMAKFKGKVDGKKVMGILNKLLGK